MTHERQHAKQWNSIKNIDSRYDFGRGTGRGVGIRYWCRRRRRGTGVTLIIPPPQFSRLDATRRLCGQSLQGHGWFFPELASHIIANERVVFCQIVKTRRAGKRKGPESDFHDGAKEMSCKVKTPLIILLCVTPNVLRSVAAMLE